MDDHALLIERLVEADKEIKRLKAQIDGHKGHAARVEKDLASLRGSHKTLVQLSRKLKVRNAIMTRALQWVVHNLDLSLVGKPGWFVRTLASVVAYEQKPVDRKEVANG